ncbi:hypothetical protein SAMN04487977_101515 [Treponema bryantii]|uniref:Uncharacterized protein n=1 Tax=Treponema bryantii TaxID=163 RepID=A0A1H9AYR6_9SPIR|nr:hypothetical protein [Treponema bryantii]SEP81749.1 hypothetical protein SAMN04487977_101515 [Treponema bryantii]
MNKEELKLHIDNRYSVCSKRNQGLSYGSFYDGYIDCYSDLENKLENVSYQLEGRELELKELNKKLSQAETDYDKMFWQKNEIISNLQAQIEKMKCYLPVDERDSDHKWFAYKNLFDTEWKIDYSVQGALPKCNTIKWFENKEAVMFYLVSNGMKYYEEPRR